MISLDDLLAEPVAPLCGVCGLVEERWGKRWMCPPCSRRRVLKHKYGITPQEYDRIYADQLGLCAICKQPEIQTRLGKPRSLLVDHDHTTGKVRGLLCTPCNTGIARFRDDPEMLMRAVKYLGEAGL